MPRKLPAINELVPIMSEVFNQILRENIYEVNLNKKAYEMLENRKKKLRLALRECAVGDDAAREYVKNMIMDILVEKFKVNEENISELIKFDSPLELSDWDKFQILLYSFEKCYGKNALEILLLKDELKEKRIISSEDINLAYFNYMPVLSFMDKLKIVTQRIYCLYKGLGIADDIRQMKIDGVSGGVSGTDESNKTLWIFFKGQSINLAFLKFGSERELERICNNIYRYNKPGQLSRSKGYIVNDMKDHSRVVVARPPFCESWVFFVRKFNKEEHKSLEGLFKQKNHELLEKLLMLLVKGCQTCAITGNQGAGKTTLLMTLIEYINPSFNLRIQELAFELHLRDLYPMRNIVTFRETDNISGQEGLDFQKKTDGSVNILGEVASAPVAGWMIQMGLTASVFTLFTHHAKTAKALISSMSNALLSENIYQDEKAAKLQVVEVIRFDIHVSMKNDGERYVERITQIGVDSNNEFVFTDILVFCEGEYILKNKIDEETIIDIAKWLDDTDKEVLLDIFA